MPNKALLKYSIKQNFGVFLIILAVLAMYIGIIISMYTPNLMESMGAMLESFPEELIKGFGFDLTATTLLDFIASYLYGFILLIVPILLEVVVAHRVIASHVDRGSMAYILATPSTRRKVAVTQLIFLEGIVIVVMAYITGLIIAVAQICFPGELAVGKLLLINVGLLGLHTAIAGICFLSSCIANEAKISLSVSVGLCVMFYLFQMVVNMGDKFAFLKYFTVLTLFNPTNIIKGETSAMVGMVVLYLIGIVSYLVGVESFRRKDLSI